MIVHIHRFLFAILEDKNNKVHYTCSHGIGKSCRNQTGMRILPITCSFWTTLFAWRDNASYDDQFEQSNHHLRDNISR